MNYLVLSTTADVWVKQLRSYWIFIIYSLFLSTIWSPFCALCIWKSRPRAEIESATFGLPGRCSNSERPWTPLSEVNQISKLSVLREPLFRWCRTINLALVTGHFTMGTDTTAKENWKTILVNLRLFRGGTRSRMSCRIWNSPQKRSLQTGKIAWWVRAPLCFTSLIVVNLISESTESKALITFIHPPSCLCACAKSLRHLEWSNETKVMIFFKLKINNANPLNLEWELH